MIFSLADARNRNYAVWPLAHPSICLSLSLSRIRCRRKSVCDSFYCSEWFIDLLLFIITVYPLLSDIAKNCLTVLSDFPSVIRKFLITIIMIYFNFKMLICLCTSFLIHFYHCFFFCKLKCIFGCETIFIRKQKIKCIRMYCMNQMYSPQWRQIKCHTQS